MLPLLAALALASPAEERQEAERLAKKSIVEYNLGDFQTALEDATRAYKLTARPGLLFNIGQCHRALHHWEQAEFFYRGYLRDKPDAENRVAVESLIQEMVDKQKEVPPGQAPTAPPLQVPLVVVQPQPLPAPPAAVEPLAPVSQAEKPVGKSRILPVALLSVAAAGLVLGGISAGELIDYQSYRNSVGNGTQVIYSNFESRGSTATLFSALLYVGIGLTVAGAGGAVLTW